MQQQVAMRTRRKFDPDRQLKLLTQVVKEDQLGAHNVRKHLIKDIMGKDLQLVFDRCISAIEVYLAGSYWESKELRINQLRAQVVSIEALVAHVFISSIGAQEAQPIHNTVSKLGSKLGYSDVFDGIRTAAELIGACVEADLYDIYYPGVKFQSLGIKSLVKLDSETLSYINQTQYLPPMVCKPRRISRNDQSGYLTKEESVILKDNHHWGKQSLDVINKLNAIQFSLDEHVLSEMEESKAELDTMDKKAQFKQFCEESEFVYDYLLQEDNQFYLSTRMDFRGRLYCSGYHVTYQGSSYKKALINLSKKVVIE